MIRIFFVLCCVAIQAKIAFSAIQNLPPGLPQRQPPLPPPFPPTDPPKCEAVPCDGPDRFCDYQIDPETCECQPFVCCSIPYCPNGYEVCDSCSNCKCNEGCPEEPCDQPDDIFCEASRDPATCECQTACCSISCPNGIDWDNCFSCSNCACLPPNNLKCVRVP